MIIIERGIHTVELYLQGVSYAAAQKIISDLYKKKMIYPKKKNVLTGNNTYVVQGLFPDGIIMHLEQRYANPGGVRFIINPHTLVSGQYVPEALYCPEKESCVLSDTIQMIQHEFEEGDHQVWKADWKKLTLSRVDLTWNLHLSDQMDLTEVIRLCKHGQRKKSAKVTHFQDLNQEHHSFRMVRSDTTLTVYDKDFQIAQKKHKKNEDTQILRVELALKSKAYRRALKMK